MGYLMMDAGKFLVNQLLHPLARQNTYLDPGSGSFIIQLLIAAAAGLAFALRGYWKKVIDFFRKNGTEDSEMDGEQIEDE
jgi:hypothetical protein